MISISKTSLYIAIISYLLIVSNACETAQPTNFFTPITSKIDGISLESPPQPFKADALTPIKTGTAADWLALSPYAFTFPNKTDIHYDTKRQWWGESSEGINTIIQHAQANGFKIMLKPQVWIMNSWVGDFTLKNEQDWLTWEKNYQDYILNFAQIATKHQVELFCIGTEYRIAAKERPKFWAQLADTIRTFYKGELVYAANWDNYEHITFWDKVDYIGIDSYFPLCQDVCPSVNKLVKSWQPTHSKLKKLHLKYQKPILFPEFGYMSVDNTAWHHWENEKNQQQLGLNLNAQNNAFEAFFRVFWHEPWFAGGFIWKWHVKHDTAGGLHDKDYTPQNKPSSEVIKKWYAL